MKESVIQKQLERERAKVRILEEMIENKTRELYLANRELAAQNSYLEGLQEAMPSALVIVGGDGTILDANPAAEATIGISRSDLLGQSFSTIHAAAEDSAQSGEEVEAEWVRPNGERTPVLVSSAQLDTDQGRVTVYLATDLRERKRLELELRHAHKLEAVGQLAAGVAHEINTPMQFIGDNVEFLGEAIDELMGVLKGYEGVFDELKRAERVEDTQKQALRRFQEAADLKFLSARAPRAVKRAMEGVRRVSAIVGAMRVFSRVDQDHAPTQLNELIETTLVVTKNEYKYVAEVQTELGPVPEVLCNSGDIGQVLLNLIVNAAHAIADKRQEGDELGQIRIRSYVDGEFAVVEVSDDGVGMRPSVQPRIFEAFFTTKPVGKGTGQGLSLAHAVVVDRHRGNLTFETTPGGGTTFFMRLPLVDRRSGGLTA